MCSIPPTLMCWTRSLSFYLQRASVAAGFYYSQIGHTLDCWLETKVSWLNMTNQAWLLLGYNESLQPLRPFMDKIAVPQFKLKLFICCLVVIFKLIKTLPWLCTIDSASLASAARFHTFCHTQHTWHWLEGCPLAIDVALQSTKQKHRLFCFMDLCFFPLIIFPPLLSLSRLFWASVVEATSLKVQSLLRSLFPRFAPLGWPTLLPTFKHLFSCIYSFCIYSVYNIISSSFGSVVFHAFWCHSPHLHPQWCLSQ